MTTSSTTKIRWLAGVLVLVLVAVAIAVVLANGGRQTRFSLDRFVLVEAVHAVQPPEVSQASAEGIALQKVSELSPTVTGLQETASHLSSSLKEVTSKDGSLVYRSDSGKDAWVFEYVGPAQNGFKNVSALVVVDAATGTVMSAQILQSN